MKFGTNFSMHTRNGGLCTTQWRCGGGTKWRTLGGTHSIPNYILANRPKICIGESQKSKNTEALFVTRRILPKETIVKRQKLSKRMFSRNVCHTLDSLYTTNGAVPACATKALEITNFFVISIYFKSYLQAPSKYLGVVKG